MPIILMHAVALAIAATITVWIAPIAVWRRSEPADDASSVAPPRSRASQAVGRLQVRHEGLD